MVKKNSKSDLLGKKKAFAKGDTSYSSFWLYNKDRDLNSEHLRDSFVNFYDDEDLLSEFSPTVAKNIISYWSDPGDLILDPFAGRTRAIVSYAMDRRYYGYEVDVNVIEYMNKKWDGIGLTPEEKEQIVIENNDCLKAGDRFLEGTVDMVFSCPPYWNLEQYPDAPGQLASIGDYDEFIAQLVIRLKICARALKTGKYMCLVVGDFRKNRRYHILHSDLIQKMRDTPSLVLHDIVVIQNIPFYSAAYYFGSRRPYKMTSKAHEYLLVWKKVESKQPEQQQVTSRELEREMEHIG